MSRKCNYATLEIELRLMSNADHDKQVLIALLKDDCRLTRLELANRIGLHRNTIPRYIRELEDDGIIKGWTIKTDGDVEKREWAGLIEIETLKTDFDTRNKIHEIAESSDIVTELALMKGSVSFVMLVSSTRSDQFKKLIDELSQIEGIRTKTRDRIAL